MLSCFAVLNEYLHEQVSPAQTPYQQPSPKATPDEADGAST